MNRLLNQVLNEVIRLSQPQPDIRYEEYEELTELRQQLVNQVEANDQPLSEEQRSIIRQILSYDAAIMERMAAYKQEAEKELRIIEIARRQRRTYETQSFDEGFLFDKKH